MNKNFMIKYFLLIFLMTFTCFTAYKVIAKIHSENQIGGKYAYEEKDSTKINVNYDENYELQKYYNENNLDQKIIDFSNCLHSYISIDNLDDNTKSIISDLENYYNKDYNNFAFYYLDINTGFTIGYNENQEIFGASVIKAPFIIYIYKQASLGNINLNDKITYTEKFYHGGSGIMKNKPFGDSYTVRELCNYAITHSDNIAYKMLADKYGINEAKKFWNELEVNSIYTYNSLFPNITAKDGGMIMKYLYDFSIDDELYGKEVMNLFTSALYNFIPKDDLVMAHKSGWAGASIHDMAIKFDDNPYILIVLSRRGEIEYQSLFNYTSEKVASIHKLFWNTNINHCINNFKN